MSTHDSTKDFWNFAVIFTGSLDKAKVKYLEYLANNEAKEVNRYALENSTHPKENNLSESDKISTKEYYKKIKYVLSVFNYPVFENIKDSIAKASTYELKGDGFDAKAKLLEDGSLLVLKDSIAHNTTKLGLKGWSRAKRETFIEDGTFIIYNEQSYKYTKDVLFKTSSAAGATTSGRSINGWTAWKDDKGITLDENLRK